MDELLAHKLSVIIPAYNEEDGICAIVDRVSAVRPALRTMGIALEIIVVDDGSHDATCERVRTFRDISLVQHPTNRGYGAALKSGFCVATGDLLGFLDADGTYPPEYFPLLCQEILRGADLVVGSRRSGAASEMPWVRRIGNTLWSVLVTLLGGQRVLDPASGMRVFRREVLERLYPLPDGLNFTPVMSTRAIHEGLHFAEVPIPYYERTGRSKLKVVKDGVRFLRTIVWTVLGYNPARLLGSIGVALCGGSLLTALTLTVMRLVGITRLGPWGVAGLYVGALAGVIGISLFSLGATFNYLVSLFHRRPIRQGLFGRPIFRIPLDRHFGWMGFVAGMVGFGIGLAALILGLNGWPIERLWFYGLIASMAILLGIQLMIFWVIMRVLEELSRRDLLAQEDLKRLF